jgi:flagellin
MATIGPTSSLRGLRETQDAIQRTFEKLSSGRRINQASDDAASLAISENLRALERGFQQGVRNLSDGISAARTAEGALSESSELVSRMRELAVQAGNGALGETEQAAIQAEFDQLSAEVTRIAEGTTFNGRNLLNGETSGAGAITLRDGSGGDDVVQVSIDDQSAAALGLQGLDVTDGNTLAALDGALQQISSTRGDLGAAESRLESGISNLESIQENTAAARSRISDTDFAVAAAERARNQILQQAQISTQVQANVTASLALHLLTS